MLVEHVSTYVPKSAPRGALREAQDGEQVRTALHALNALRMLKSSCLLRGRAFLSAFRLISIKALKAPFKHL